MRAEDGAGTGGFRHAEPMPTPPDGAQVSDDGYYWWDEANATWQPVHDDGAAGAAGAASGDAAGVAAAGTEWPPAGYPADPAEWTDEQLQYWFGNTQDATEPEALGGDMVQVVAIADLEGNANEGLA